MKEKKTRFIDLKVGDYVYRIIRLWVYNLKIVKIKADPKSQSMYIYFKPIKGDKGYNINSIYVGKYFSSSCSSTVFTEKRDAWEKLIGDSQARYKELADEIDERITEFDKLEEFLNNVKGKTLW
jgi:hypothetical protein